MAVEAPVAVPTLKDPLTLEQCVALALKESPKIVEAEARVAQYKARLAEVQAIYTPKISALGFVAPMFTVRGSALERNVDRDFSPDAWGPYAHLEAVLALPLYTFGRAEHGADAARARAAVEEARVRQTRNVVSLEVRRLYYTHLFARSLVPALQKGLEMVEEARTQGREKYEAGTGEVTQVDLMKLEYGHAEMRRFTRLAQDAAALSHAALGQAMGLPDGAEFTLAEKRLARVKGPAETPELPEVIKLAAEARPEWDQLNQGRAAALSLEAAERMANAPTVFLGGNLNADWAPTRDDAPNPYHNDPYNRVIGGVAVGLQWGFDPGTAAARGDAARAQAAEVEALARFARSGIPLQVREAHQAIHRHRDLVDITRDSVKATRKWMTSAANAYRIGTGSARDLLEGLAAHLEARRSYYGALRGYYEARAELWYAVGRVIE